MTKSLRITAIILILVLNLTSPAYSEEEEPWGDFLSAGSYYTLLDPDNEVLLQTGRRIYPGDEFLSGENKLYKVQTADDKQQTAQAELLEIVELEVFPWEQLQRELELNLAAAEAEEEKGKTRGKIAIYHTHNAESYVPSEGTDSINGKGGIHRVGAAFAQALAALGIDVDYSEKMHLPHDRGAYRRSRETVLELLAKHPDAIFDVHRDAAPQSAYALQLGNEWITRIQFVVGRQNQNLGINRKYALSLKKIADDLYPGLVKGIFFGRGNYNQDLTPLSLLLEVGAHTNSRPAAERGVSLFSEVVDFYFYGPKAEAAGRDQGQAARRSITGLLFFVATGLVVFFVINAGGFLPAWERLKRLARGLKVK
ncbi:MAG: stage II sporulation protein P [Firmicutes bacterium]|nr:stage II sporulation protein P [Bacillota bacterium]